ncbi:MAG TPA: CBS domain-containing protein [Coleofasciculaceae cyanobacterium]|jgi:signal transduction histidine kinase
MQPKGLPPQSLALAPAIDSHFLTVVPDTPLVDALALMSRFRSCLLPSGDLDGNAKQVHTQNNKIHCVSQEWETVLDLADTAGGCVLVMEKSRLIGVFTERDIVRLTAADIPLSSVKIAEVVTRPPITLKQSPNHDVFTALGLFRQHRIRHLPIVDEQGQPVGIVTHDSIRRALQPVNLLTRLRYVKDVMTTQVIHAPVTACVLELAKLMTQHQVSCVVICQCSVVSCQLSVSTNNGQSTTGNGQLTPVGIVTERDVVQFQALELDLSRMSAQDVMSTPLFCLQPADSLWYAHEQMQRYQVRRLIVASEQGELVGIVSQTSLLQVLNPADMYGVIEILQQIVEERTSELKETNEQLRHEIVERQRAEAALLKAHDQLKIQVEERTAQLTQANAQLKQDLLERQRVEAALRQSEAKLRKQATQLKLALQELHSYQTQLIQTEKMSSLGHLVAGIAHEINNPINFVYGNIDFASQYIHDIMQLLELYEQEYPRLSPKIQEEAKKIDLAFVKTDLPKLIYSMKLGAERIRDLVLSLRNFSRLDESEMKSVNLHEGLDSTLLILQNQLKATPERSEIRVIKEYGNLPLVECYPGQLNQVFMNLISNAIDALEESRMLNSPFGSPKCQLSIRSPSITIHTGLKDVKSPETIPQFSAHPTISALEYTSHAVIRIADNGAGMTEAVCRHLFDPFFTTKPVGKGTGLGLSISYQIVVEKHGGRIHCNSDLGQGTEFIVEIPIRQQNQSAGFAIA